MESLEALEEDLFCTAPGARGASASLASSAAHLTRFLAAAKGAKLLARFSAACVRLLFFCVTSENAA